MEQGGAIKEMPIAIELKKFIMETYEDGKPKRYASEIQILTKSGKNIETTIDVNKPYEVDGWKIYQYGYDTQMGAQSQITILELVSDQWLPWVYAGFYMMLAGVVVMTLISSFCKCVGGALTTCHQPKVQAYTPIAPANKQLRGGLSKRN